ncbi:hypothetical protein PG993_001083 [Apiospora rasikravindrae]|uniref:DUF788 domain-containing protein n=1 Tax=Apiospora rasikravindrae TaxID=990691 RepID=A0ABR1UAE1_9PEZI
MAQKARKHIAKANADALKNLHLGTLILHSLFVLSNVLFRRRALLPYILLSIPSFICEYVLERTGRPKFDPATKALRSAGEDLSAPGLTEYMFDVIWVTWGAIVSVIFFGNWGWLLWLVLPIFAAIKGYKLLGAARGMASGPQAQQQPDAAAMGNRKQRRAA